MSRYLSGLIALACCFAASAALSAPAPKTAFGWSINPDQNATVDPAIPAGNTAPARDYTRALRGVMAGVAQALGTRGQPNGLAPLDANRQIPASSVPIGPNGFPALGPDGKLSAGTIPTGANGFPQLGSDGRLAPTTLPGTYAPNQINLQGTGSTGPVDGMSVLATNAQTRATLADIAARRRWWKDYGLVCDGVTAEGAAIQAALNLIAGLGGGTFDIAERRCVAGPTTIVVPKNVMVAGNRPSAPILSTTGGYDSLPSAFVFPKNTSYGVFVQARGGLRGMAVLTDGLQLPGGTQQAASIVAGWQGVGVTIGSDSDQAHNASLDNVLVMGFNTGVKTVGSSQVRMRHVFVDAVNGFSFDGSKDNLICTDCRAFPQFTSFQPWTTADMTVTGAARQDFGAIRLTVNSTAGFTGNNAATGFITGVGGTTEANGKWSLNIIDATHVDLVGSAYTNAYTGGGRLRVNANKRYGTAFQSSNSDGDTCFSCFSYGYDRGFYATSGARTTDGAGNTVYHGTSGFALYDSGTDDDLSLYDPNRIGVLIDGDADRLQMIGGAISSAGTAIAVANAPPFSNPHTFLGVQIGATGKYAVNIASGSVSMAGDTLTGGAPIRLQSGAGSFSYGGMSLGGSPFVFDNAGDNYKVNGIGPNSGLSATGPALITGNLTVTGAVTTNGGVVAPGVDTRGGALQTSFAGYSAAGTTQASATPVVSGTVVVTGGTGGVRLRAVVGERTEVVNRSNATINIYAATGAQIEGGPANNSTSLASPGTAVFYTTGATQHFRVQ